MKNLQLAHAGGCDPTPRGEVAALQTALEDEGLEGHRVTLPTAQSEVRENWERACSEGHVLDVLPQRLRLQ